MRRLFVATLIFLAGCAAEGLPLEGGGTGGSGATGRAAADMARAPDLGGDGAKCASACDCRGGLACFQGACTRVGGFSVYCCESPDCPAGSACQSKSGGFGQCGASGGGPGGGGPGGGGPGGGGPGGGGPGGFPDGGPSLPDGGANFCGFIPCTASRDCAQIGCGKCDRQRGTCRAK